MVQAQQEAQAQEAGHSAEQAAEVVVEQARVSSTLGKQPRSQQAPQSRLLVVQVAREGQALVGGLLMEAVGVLEEARMLRLEVQEAPLAQPTHILGAVEEEARAGFLSFSAGEPLLIPPQYQWQGAQQVRLEQVEEVQLPEAQEGTARQ